MTTATTILLIEDNTFDAKVFRYAVQGAGLNASVTVARDGVEGMAVLRDRKLIDDLLVVTDLNMPRMDGIELLKAIRSTTRLAHLPVFVMTTSGLPCEHDRASELGIEGYIRKSDDEHDMIQPIIAYLASQKGQEP